MALKLALFLILLSFATINFKTKGKHKLLRICGITFGILTLLFHFLSTNIELKSIPIPVKTINQTTSSLNIYSISFYESRKPIVEKVGKVNPGKISNASVEIEGVSDLWLVAIDKNREIKQMMKREDREFNLQFNVIGKDVETSGDKEMASKLIKRFRLEGLVTWLIVSISTISILILAINWRKNYS